MQMHDSVSILCAFSATHRGHLWIMTLRVRVANFDMNQPVAKTHPSPRWVVEFPGKSCPSLGMSLKCGIKVEQCGGAMGKDGKEGVGAKCASTWHHCRCQRECINEKNNQPISTNQLSLVCRGRLNCGIRQRGYHQVPRLSKTISSNTSHVSGAFQEVMIPHIGYDEHLTSSGSIGVHGNFKHWKQKLLHTLLGIGNVWSKNIFTYIIIQYILYNCILHRFSFL